MQSNHKEMHNKNMSSVVKKTTTETQKDAKWSQIDVRQHEFCGSNVHFIQYVGSVGDLLHVCA